MSLKDIRGKKLEGMLANMQIKKMNINEKIRGLNDDDKKKFGKIFTDNLYDRYWCRSHKIDYADPNIQIAKEKTYQEMEERDKLKQ